MFDWLDSWPGALCAIGALVLIMWVGERLRGPDGREDIEQM